MDRAAGVEHDRLPAHLAAYNVPTSQPYGDSTLAMPINGRRSDAGRRTTLRRDVEQRRARLTPG